MDGKLRNRWLVIFLVVGFCAYALYPPGETLVLGPDLAGGTTLLYEVSVPKGDNRRDTMQRVIEVVQKRVDPDGVRNLSFREVAGGRLQILMPHPSNEVLLKREAYRLQLEAVTAANVPKGRLISALEQEDDARDKLLESLVKSVEARRAIFEELKSRRGQVRTAEASLKETSAQEGSDEYTELARAVNRARRAYQESLDRFEATNVDPAKLATAMESSTRDKSDDTGESIPGSSERATALAKLYERHPERRSQIEALVVARDDYFSQKRPLDDANDLIRLMQGQGELHFRIAVEPSKDSVSDIDGLVRELRERGPGALGRNGPWAWFAIDDVDAWLDDYARGPVGRSTPERRQALAALKERLASDPHGLFLEHDLIGGTDGKEYYLLLWNTKEKSLANRPEQPDWRLTAAAYDTDQMGRPAVRFQLNVQGTGYFGELTKNNVGRAMGIVLDGRIGSAPNINEPITAGNGIITGRFSDADLNYLIRTLSAGSLQAQLSTEPIEVRTIQPTLGKDNLDRGLKAAWFALLAVAVFMTLYYYFGGIVANLAMLANLVIILGVMSQMQATFTLAGIAGIILNIGMCVDANVLIFERIREELRRGSDMKTALRLGHDKAWSAIIDGNLTTLIVCLVLGYYGTADIKGFGVSLGIGLVANLFTAVFMAQAILRTRLWISPKWKMGMLPLTFPGMEKALRPTVDWVGKRRVFYTVSIIACVASLVLCFRLGGELFDIEFRAGTEVSFKLAGDLKLSHAEVDKALESTDLADATVVVIGETDAENRGSEFSIITQKTDTAMVSTAIRTALGTRLDIRPVLSYTGSDSQAPPGDRYEPVTTPDLSQSIRRTAPQDVSDYRGGVAILLDNVTPSVTPEQVAERIKSMRLHPEHEGERFRLTEVFGLDPDPASPDNYTSLAVVSYDPGVDYFENEELWRSELVEKEWRVVRDALTREQSFSKVSRFTPQVARTMIANAVAALALGLAGILAYIWFRFGSLRYGIMAVVSMVHDVTVTLGFIALSHYIYQAWSPNPLLIIPFKINMGMIAALLTIIGYSLNDTIVVFDRIRENRGKLAHASAAVINDSINQTFSRTFLTGGGVLMSVLLLYGLGGEAMRGFAMTMFVGIVAGTYSSVALASPLLLFGVKSDVRETTTP